MKDYSFKSITANKLPIYLHGAFGIYSDFVLNWLKENGGVLSGVFDRNFLAVHNADRYAGRVAPPPNDVTTLPRGVVIISVEERNQRECQAQWRKGDWHEVIDVQDIIFYPEYLRCLENKNEGSLKKCVNCPAAYRHCPVRSRWHEKQTGQPRDKVIRHIAVKAGFICNLKCKYCCEFIPSFENKHKRLFDADGLISDIKKLSNSLEYIKILSLSGGDVLLNKKLAQVLEAIVEFDNIGDIYLLTNGTYIPPAQTLDAIQQNNAKIRIVINDYERNNKAIALIDELNNRGIRNLLRPNKGWYDLSDLRFRSRSVNELKQIYNTCLFDNSKRHYHIMTEGKINVRCGVANSILYFLDNYDELTQDYIDIRKLSNEQIPVALTALEDRGYLDACNFCATASDELRTLVAAKDQL